MSTEIRDVPTTFHTCDECGRERTGRALEKCYLCGADVCGECVHYIGAFTKLQDTYACGRCSGLRGTFLADYQKADDACEEETRQITARWRAAGIEARGKAQP